MYVFILYLYASVFTKGRQKTHRENENRKKNGQRRGCVLNETPFCVCAQWNLYFIYFFPSYTRSSFDHQWKYTAFVPLYKQVSIDGKYFLHFFLHLIGWNGNRAKKEKHSENSKTQTNYKIRFAFHSRWHFDELESYTTNTYLMTLLLKSI